MKTHLHKWEANWMMLDENNCYGQIRVTQSSYFTSLKRRAIQMSSKVNNKKITEMKASFVFFQLHAAKNYDPFFKASTTKTGGFLNHDSKKTGKSTSRCDKKRAKRHKTWEK